MTSTALRASQLSRYNDDAVLSAPPARLLTMLYDRLLLDLNRAQFAQENANWGVASENLLHAQAIVTELSSTLKTDAWDGASGLLSIYQYAMEAMVGANIYRDVNRTKECIVLLEPLRQAGTTPPRSCPSKPPYPGRRGRMARSVSADHVQEWSDILDRLELNIAMAVSGGEPEPWSPPAEAGPLPEELADRAHGILDAQLESMAMLEKARNGARAHLDALSTVPDGQGSARPLFLDVQG